MFQFYLSAFLQTYFSQDQTGFEALARVEGDVFREVKGRRTVAFTRGGKRFFLKFHRGFDIWEIVKNVITFKWPVLGAHVEWRAIERLQQLGISTLTLAGKGFRGVIPGSGGSLIVTEALEDTISLEDLLDRRETISPRLANRLKRHLIERLAETSRRMHEAGLNHRDYYLCHFLIKNRDWGTWTPFESIDPVLIDLHRVQIRRNVPVRWKVKDLGALMFSAFGADITVQDAVRFIRVYSGGGTNWKQRYRNERTFWHRVVARALGFQREWDLRMARQARDTGE